MEIKKIITNENPYFNLKKRSKYNIFSIQNTINKRFTVGKYLNNQPQLLYRICDCSLSHKITAKKIHKIIKNSDR